MKIPSENPDSLTKLSSSFVNEADQQALLPDRFWILNEGKVTVEPVLEDVSGGRPHTLRLRNGSVFLDLSASGSEDRDMWTVALREAINFKVKYI